jgi:hypothetical protein
MTQLLQAAACGNVTVDNHPPRCGNPMTSGGTRASGGHAPRIGTPAPHGAVVALTDNAAKVLAAACTLLDGDGTICGTVPEIAQRAGISVRSTEKGLAELRTTGLIHVRGQTRLTYRYVDARVRKALQLGVGKRTADAGWRELRARLGGFERALRESQRREAEAKRLVATLAARDAHGPTAIAGGAAIDAHLRAEARHALACLDGPDHCDRCAGFRAVLDEGTREEASAAAQLRLEEAADVAEAARAVVAAFRAGDHATRARALGALERLVQP